MAAKMLAFILPGIALFVSISAFQHRHSISKFQDIKMYNENGTLQCDQTKCPNGTTWCHVVKQNSEENPIKIRRENTCYDESNNVLKEKIWTEENDGKKIVDINMDLFASGGSSIISKQTTRSSSNKAYYDDDDDENIVSYGFNTISQFIGSIFRKVGTFISSFDDIFF